MLHTLCDSVHVHYFQLAMIVQFYIHNYATGIYEVCMYSTGSLVPRPYPAFQSACNIENMGVAWGRGYSTGTLNNGLVAVTNSIFTLEQVLVYHQPQPRQPVGFG